MHSCWDEKHLGLSQEFLEYMEVDITVQSGGLDISTAFTTGRFYVTDKQYLLVASQCGQETDSFSHYNPHSSSTLGFSHSPTFFSLKLFCNRFEGLSVTFFFHSATCLQQLKPFNCRHTPLLPPYKPSFVFVG